MAPSRFVTTVTLLLVAVLSAVQACIHDQINHNVVSHEQEYDPLHPFTEEGRRRRRMLREEEDPMNTQSYDRVVGDTVDVAMYQPIRITPYYDNTTLNALSSDKRAVIFDIMSAAIEQFRLALQVVPVQGNLMAKRWCQSQWRTTPPVCHEYLPDETCLDMPIPLDHFGPTRECLSCTSTNCVNDPCTTTAGKGIANTDFLLYVRATETDYCSGMVLAYATSCQKDQFDRPTFGMVNFCPEYIDPDPHEYKRQLSTALHEITHALGFSSRFYAYMRDADGWPRTARDTKNEPPIFKTGTCKNGNAVDYFIAPSDTTVQYVNERSHVVAKLVTPAVAEFVQSHFNCPTVIGAELENHDDGCLGSHWEERLFESEFMSPVSSYHNVFSGLTLAFFQDSGWYRANMSMAERLHFGENKGCTFARDNCIDSATQKSVAPDHYCTSNAYESCSVDATSRSVCTVKTAMEIPAPYRYFMDDPTKGGNNYFADYCPINTGFSYGDCAVLTNLILPEGTTINILGETYCPTCKCTRSTLRSADSTAWRVPARRQTGCYAMKCAADRASVEITLPTSSSGVVTVNCTAKGVAMKVAGFTGTLTCPDPSIVCDASNTDATTESTRTPTPSETKKNTTSYPPASTTQTPTAKPATTKKPTTTTRTTTTFATPSPTTATTTTNLKTTESVATRSQTQVVAFWMCVAAIAAVAVYSAQQQLQH